MRILMLVLMPEMVHQWGDTVSLRESLREGWTPRWNWGFASREEGKNGCWVTPLLISFNLRLKAHGQPPSTPLSCLPEIHPGQPILWKGPACMTAHLPSAPGFLSRPPRFLAGTLTLTPQWCGKEQQEWTVRPRQDAEMEVLTQHVFWDQVGNFGRGDTLQSR